MLEDTRLLMFDLKHMDERAHIQHTGISLQPVLQNARLAAQRQLPVIVRTPLIAGVNDDEEIIRAIAGFLKENFDDQLLYYELLTFHPMGTDKAVQLGNAERSRPMEAPKREKMQALARAAARCGVPVRMDGAVWKG